MKNEVNPSTTTSKTPYSYKKFLRKDKSKNKSSYQQQLEITSSKAKNHKNSKSNEKKNSAVSRQIATKASKMLSYSSKSKFLTKQRNEMMRTPESSIRSIKQSSINSIKKNLIQSMLTSKLSSVSHFKVRLQENQPKVQSKFLTKNSKLQWSSGKANFEEIKENTKSRNLKSLNKDFYSRNFSQQINRNLNDKVHSKNKEFSPIQSAKDNESEESIEDYEDCETHKLNEHSDRSKMTSSRRSEESGLKNSEIQKIVKMNLELIQTLSEVIQSSKNIVNVLTHAGYRNTFSINEHKKLIRNLKQKLKD